MFKRCLGLGLMMAAILAWSGSAAAQVRPPAGGSNLYGNSLRAGLKGDALIQFDRETGSLIVVTDEETNEQIGKIVESLDLPVPQVLINVLFLEVTHTDDLELGVESSYHHEKKYPFSTQVDSQTLQTIFGLANQTTGAFYRIIDGDLDVTVRALAEVTKLEVLSRPSILTRNNQQAMITVGKRVPFIQNSRITYDGQTINTVTYDDIGIILRVTPHISEDRIVSMDVTPEISTLTGETVPISSNVNAPVFATRSAQTGVVVPDGRTVVIGGLMEDSKTRDSKKVPLLGSIPGLGALFRSRADNKSKTELLIFLTPHVVENVKELEDTSASERASSELAPKAFSTEQIDRFIGKSPDEGLSADAAAPDSDPPPASKQNGRTKKGFFSFRKSAGSSMEEQRHK